MKTRKRTLVEREQLVEIDRYSMERRTQALVVLVVYKPVLVVVVVVAEVEAV